MNASLLMVEDSKSLAALMRKELAARGYEVLGVYATAEKLLHKMGQLREQGGLPDVVLVDISLPGEMDGIEAAEVITRDFQRPVIFITGSDFQKYFASAMTTKPHAYLLKPFHIDQAAASIEIALYQKGLEDTLNRRQAELLELNEQLEKRVAERARELMEANRKLREEMERRKQTSLELEASHHNLRTSLEETVRALAATVEIRDVYTSGHQECVAELACRIAREMGMTQEFIKGLRVGGILHDIGKIAIPSEILTKPTRLMDLEFAIIKEHPSVGYNLLRGIPFSRPVAEMVHQHHERMNGSGYPKGLAGEDILREARILAVADVVEAMSSHRPYRPAQGLDKALAEIESGRGALYAPEAVDACLAVFRQEPDFLERCKT